MDRTRLYLLTENKLHQDSLQVILISYEYIDQHLKGLNFDMSVFLSQRLM